MLLDLLGGPEPLIVNHFDNTARWFDRLITAGISSKQPRCKKHKKSLVSIPLCFFFREETAQTGFVDISPIRTELLQKRFLSRSRSGWSHSIFKQRSVNRQHTLLFKSLGVRFFKNSLFFISARMHSVVYIKFKWYAYHGCVYFFVQRHK